MEAATTGAGVLAWRVRVPAGIEIRPDIMMWTRAKRENLGRMYLTGFAVALRADGTPVLTDMRASAQMTIDHDGESTVVGAGGARAETPLVRHHLTEGMGNVIGMGFVGPGPFADPVDLYFGFSSNEPMHATFSLEADGDVPEPVLLAGGPDRVSVVRVTDMVADFAADGLPGAVALNARWSRAAVGPSLVMAVPLYNEGHWGPGGSIYMREGFGEVQITTPDGETTSYCSAWVGCEDHQPRNAYVDRAVGPYDVHGHYPMESPAVAFARGRPGTWEVRIPRLFDPKGHIYRLWFVDLGS
ncbi:MAG: hypothetical protein HY775_03540 [Acidobacteria bacterium]|nr:hypothetical protein [Acidobacteriota bacterium]